MVMESHGVMASEAAIHLATNCDETGATIAGLLKAAQRFGFDNTQRIFLAASEPVIFNELNEILAEGVYPIVYLKPMPSRNVDSHAVIILSINEQGVVLLDPLKGERSLSSNRFLFEWANANRTLILVRQ